ncbi:PREDICTED: LOW QUALITY PROTEIN: arginine--tRNA ligase, cytoplasmic-like [Priapulus caudatus]|uniref:arginine--tRNA ligase n=1 Tax=Priapulus caudatus TaxID=37621 RepID=A0ABM1EUH3_PRICU|nr:PREDICTED: LOW QUALITY PROTEIN: arginine--tRNA ligase, cytoplasmic-like [Priapulus caudatus]
MFPRLQLQDLSPDTDFHCTDLPALLRERRLRFDKDEELKRRKRTAESCWLQRGDARRDARWRSQSATVLESCRLPSGSTRPLEISRTRRARESCLPVAHALSSVRLELEERQDCSRRTRDANHATGELHWRTVPQPGRHGRLRTTRSASACSHVGFGVVLAATTEEASKDAAPDSNSPASTNLPTTVSPRDVAAAIVANLPRNDVTEEGAEVAGPGFVNVRLRRSFVARRLADALARGPRAPAARRLRRVCIDMSSPNVAREMHVGHLRSTIIGEGVARLLAFVGHEVEKVNHVGDWGTQFGMLIAHLADCFPDYNYKTSPPTPLPIADLQSFYRESKVRFDKDEEFKRRAYAEVVRLQRGDADATRAWSLICDVSRCDFERIYERLGISDLVERGESFYQSRMVDVVRELEERGLLQEDEGRKIMFPPGRPIPLTVVKSDGGYTYDTSDLAAIRHRIVEDRRDWIVYVVDSGQGVHLENVFAGAAMAGWYDLERERVQHVGFGVVLGDDRKKFKTRSGATVRLSDLLDEGVRRADAKLREKEREKALTEEELRRARDAIAYGCMKYADLSHCRTNDYVFSFDKMLEDHGNTAVYLLYAHARIKSIARSAGVDVAAETARGTSVSLAHEREWRLAKTLLLFGEVVARAADDLMLHSICEYMYDIACRFSEFYERCYCIERREDGTVASAVNVGRVLLCEATAATPVACAAPQSVGHPTAVDKGCEGDTLHRLSSCAGFYILGHRRARLDKIEGDRPPPTLALLPQS